MSPILIFLVAASVNAAEPAWWSERPAAPGFVIGIGAGADPDRARLRAAADLIESLAVDVSSARSSASQQQSVDGNSTLSEAFDQRFATSSAIRDLPGLLVTAHAEDGGLHFIQLRIAEGMLLPELARRCAGLAPRHLPPPAPPTWAWATEARRELAILRERERLAAILTSRGVAVAPSPTGSAQQLRELGLLARHDALAVLGAPGADRDALIAALGKTGMGIAATADLILEPEVVPTAGRTERGWYQLRLAMAVTVRNGPAAILGRIACSAEGTSTRDAAAAERAARERLGTALDAAIADQLLPLLLSHPPE